MTGHSYALSDIIGNADDVRAEALALGGDLVSVNSAAEEAFLETTFGGLTDNAYIGLYAKGGVWGDWAWYNGDPTSYFDWGNFGVPEPNNTTPPENNVIAVFNPSTGWADVNPSQLHRGIIEFVPDTGLTSILLSAAIVGLNMFRSRNKR